MIEDVTGNLLEADAEAYVNTVNTVGVMGKGIALQIRQAFPAVYKEYRRGAKRGEVKPGHMFVVPTGQVMNPRFVINFPTKRHWRGKARLDDITSGLGDLVRVIREKGIRSVAVPPLGCGSGGLDWRVVKPHIEAALGALTDVRVLLFAPAGAPEAERMRVQTTKPRLTPARAAIIRLFEDYAVPGYRLTLLEIQKLAYFLQVAGEPLRLRFVKAAYGPYAETLHHVLQRLEGHAIRGYGDRSRGASIRVLPGVGAEAAQVLESEPDTRTRLGRVSRLIQGLETPYGLELLSTVHWVAQEDQGVGKDPAAAVAAVHAWSHHKRAIFHAEHVIVAWKRLREQEWI